MAMKYKEVGGGAAKGLSDDFIGMLQKGIQTGSFGAAGSTSQAGSANPVGDTQGIAGVLNDLLAGGGGRVGGAMSQMITKQGDRDAAALRARFGAGGGTAFGTGAQYAEGVLRSETAPKLTTAIGGLQQSALQQLLPIIAGLSSKGISQRETIGEENPWMTGAKLGLSLGGDVLGYIGAGKSGANAPSGTGPNWGSSGVPTINQNRGMQPPPYQVDWNERFKQMGI